VWFVTFDCPDPRRTAEFWATALSYEIEAPNEHAGEVLLKDPKGVGQSLGFMKVPEPKVVKNRVHLDLHPDGRLEDEVERLVAAGATIVETRQDPDDFVDPVIWTVMRDPDDNEFCVIEELSRR
jgi:predicted enzyme related to lactoylglutathione lyase